ncbi:DNA topology modulation protein [Ureibacillus chungkukjangi]|uniref:Adenylate kinase family enzyme n=1 Tax=Ureibacillus chungkukjangi TaxID=1202712 RepID=A0A318TRZ1_9BACL|nr:DNA topology modulation protein [Ureibacillus chungkukjangi]MCM3388788.1 DNA topology modulation protein [Ureibacillus chungkukjangi]PYF06697.1 adenylate kinase family enzyme [Ureibacillus chungkukjangi]
MKRIAIIGSGGAGKSTLARKLGKLLKIEVFHLDALFWKPGWVGASREEQKMVQSELVENEYWIFDGNYGGTMDIRLNKADTVIFLDFPRTLCAYRIIKRRFQYRNKTRPDMGEGCDERLDLEFLKWVWNFPKTKRLEILRKLESFSSNKEIIILTSPKEIKRFLHTIETAGNLNG